ncbi:hypothetical protein RJ640_001353 [Escallonia rubra]|uniref:Reverse transcriptase Ty1/copia-type domain-containing protein n=1 Tax=Escallonia rubra TaxID=112253 RepID=A0AA88UCA7_9ASTE|nr:hypothetical protein RJ640_001353 [Escallonia rubra]
MSMMGELTFFLGLQIKQSKDEIFINQAKYTKELLKRFDMEASNAFDTPMISSLKFDKDEKDKDVDIKRYRAYRAYKAWDLSEKWDLELEIMDKTRLGKAMYKVICLSLMGQLLASLILPQDISEKNKNNQKEKKLVQTTGKESYALVRERKKVELGHDPSRVEMFIECHSKKDENRTPSTVEAANYMAQMNEKREKLPEGSQDVPSENDILAQVMGKDKYGRARMYGLGVSQSDDCNGMEGNCEQMEERFNNRIDELKSMFLRHRGREESISETSSPATSINHRPQIMSTQLLRPFQVAVKKDERLIRSYGFHKTIYDAYGATVAWPCPYCDLADYKAGMWVMLELTLEQSKYMTEQWVETWKNVIVRNVAEMRTPKKIAVGTTALEVGAVGYQVG